jgi:hypothetical protein
MTPKQIDQIIYDTAISQGYNTESARYVVAQARLESANYTSNVFKNNNNLFGMSYAGQNLATKGTIKPVNERDAKCRKTGICANANYYAKYADVKDAIIDRLVRYGGRTINQVTPKMLKDSTTPEQYARLLKLRGYYTASQTQYAKLLRNISSTLSIKKKIKRDIDRFNDFIRSLLN